MASPEPSVRRLVWGQSQHSSVKAPLIPKTQDTIFFSSPEGFATDLSQSTSPWMMLILLLQLIACILRGVYVQDLIGCFWFAAVCCLGFYALINNMRMNNIGIWGCACCVNVAFDIVSFAILAAAGSISMDLEATSTIIRVATPFPQIIGALYAWLLWRDYTKQASNTAQEPMKAPSPYGSDLSLNAYREQDRPGSDGSFADKFQGLYSMYSCGCGGKAEATLGHGRGEDTSV